MSVYGATWGYLRGNPIHLECVNEEGMQLTWASFNGPSHPDRAEDKVCVNCGGDLNQDPLPGYAPICPDFA